MGLPCEAVVVHLAVIWPWLADAVRGARTRKMMMGASEFEMKIQSRFIKYSHRFVLTKKQGRKLIRIISNFVYTIVRTRITKFVALWCHQIKYCRQQRDGGASHQW